MIKVSAIRPQARAAATIKWREELAYEEQSKIRAWGLEVIITAMIMGRFAQLPQFNTAMIKIQARLLDPPRILYANNADASARDGSWRLGGHRVSDSSTSSFRAVN